MVKTGYCFALSRDTHQTEPTGQRALILPKRFAHEPLYSVPSVSFAHFTADSDANFQ